MSDAESKMYLIEHAEVILFWLMDETDATHGPDSLITSLLPHWLLRRAEFDNFRRGAIAPELRSRFVDLATSYVIKQLRDVLSVNSGTEDVQILSAIKTFLSDFCGTLEEAEELRQACCELVLSRLANVIGTERGPAAVNLLRSSSRPMICEAMIAVFEGSTVKVTDLCLLQADKYLTAPTDSSKVAFSQIVTILNLIVEADAQYRMDHSS
ncbi:hypothetical protein EMMF5_002043 [Cystobasidiomycetes sp. EMM_F5]